MLQQTRAIFWAQWRTLLNFYSKGNWGVLGFTVLLSLGWYAMTAFGAVAVQMICAVPERLPLVQQHGAQVLFFTFVYWQVIPILLASTGMALDLKRLAVYPISKGELFLTEVLLRFSTGLEMLMILSGAAIGLLRNPAVPMWAPLAFLPWLALNLLLSAGLRDLLTRLLARRRTRELAMILFVLIAALPQLLLVTGVPDVIKQGFTRLGTQWWPWQITARLVTGQADLPSVLGLLGWTALAAWFGHWQFQRGFRFDADAARATVGKPGTRDRLYDRFFRLPSLIFPDPLAAVLEKELRFLCRAPRFRLVFLMGFTFGIVIWLPLGSRNSPSFFSTNYLSLVSFYSLALLGEVCFWNSFGFDRGAVQFYYVTAVPFNRILLAKNIVALFFVLVEVFLISIAASFFHAHVTVGNLLETLAVISVVSVFLLAAGNMSSVLFPRPVDPGQWRAASPGRFQALLFVLYPLVAAPVVLAYLARYAFDTQFAFYATLAADAVLAAIVYWVSLDSAVRLSRERCESMVAALSSREGPISS